MHCGTHKPLASFPQNRYNSFQIERHGVMINKLLAKNLRRPSGFFGRLVGREMNRANRAMNRAAVHHLQPRADEQILEIGFGGGASLIPIAEHLREGCICGVDLSDDMIALASRKHPGLIEAGRIDLKKAPAEQLPFEEAHFDRALSVNTLYFWEDPDKVAGEVLRVLKPGGTFVLAFRPKDVMKRYKFIKHGFTLYADEEVFTLLQRAGFESIRFERGKDDRIGYVCAVAKKPL